MSSQKLDFINIAYPSFYQEIYLPEKCAFTITGSSNGVTTALTTSQPHYIANQSTVVLSLRDSDGCEIINYSQTWTATVNSPTQFTIGYDSRNCGELTGEGHEPKDLAGSIFSGTIFQGRTQFLGGENANGSAGKALLTVEIPGDEIHCFDAGGFVSVGGITYTVLASSPACKPRGARSCCPAIHLVLSGGLLSDIAGEPWTGNYIDYGFVGEPVIPLSIAKDDSTGSIDLTANLSSLDRRFSYQYEIYESVGPAEVRKFHGVISFGSGDNISGAVARSPVPVPVVIADPESIANVIIGTSFISSLQSIGDGLTWGTTRWVRGRTAINDTQMPLYRLKSNVGQVIDGSLTLSTTKANSVWSALTGGWVTPEMFGAVGGTTSSSVATANDAAFAAMFAHCARSGDRIMTGDTQYSFQASLTPEYEFKWFAHNTSLRFLSSGTYTPVKEYVGGVLTDSAVKVAFDTLNSRGHSIYGNITLIGFPATNFKKATQKVIDENLAAYTSSNSPGGYEAHIESLTILGFGYALYQGDHRTKGGNGAVLPYTRSRFGYLEIRHCLQGMVSGPSGTGFDDAVFQVVRFSRSGSSDIWATEFNVNSCFFYGSNLVNDGEAQTITTTANSPTITLSAANADLEVGDFICIDNASENKTTALPHVSRINAIAGTTITLEIAPLRSVTGAAFCTVLSQMILSSGMINAMHFYVEGNHVCPLHVRYSSIINTMDLKVTRGDFSSVLNTVMLCTYLESSITAGLNPRANSDGYNTLIAYQNVRDPELGEPTEFPAHSARIHCAFMYDEFTLNQEFIAVVPPIPSFTDNTFNSNVGNRIGAFNVEVTTADQTAYFNGLDGTNIEAIRKAGRWSRLQTTGGKINSIEENVAVLTLNTPTTAYDFTGEPGFWLITAGKIGSNVIGMTLITKQATGNIFILPGFPINNFQFGVAGQVLTIEGLGTGGVGTYNIQAIRLR